jgi:hypothetical protein
MASRRTTSRSTRVLALLACAAASAWTVAATAEEDLNAPLNLFISPAGKPFRADPGKPYPVVDWFNAADTDHDGKLTKAEFRADAEAFYRELDINKDGIIDSREVAYYERITAPEIIQSFAPDLPQQSEDGPKLKDPPQGGAWYGLLGEPEPVAAADTNFDNVITHGEFMQATDERWKLLDPDKKGYITLDSLPKTPIQEKLAQAARHKHRR